MREEYIDKGVSTGPTESLHTLAIAVLMSCLKRKIVNYTNEIPQESFIVFENNGE